MSCGAWLCLSVLSVCCVLLVVCRGPAGRVTARLPDLPLGGGFRPRSGWPFMAVSSWTPVLGARAGLLALGRQIGSCLWQMGSGMAWL